MQDSRDALIFTQGPCQPLLSKWSSLLVSQFIPLFISVTVPDPIRIPVNTNIYVTLPIIAAFEFPSIDRAFRSGHYNFIFIVLCAKPQLEKLLSRSKSTWVGRLTPGSSSHYLTSLAMPLGILELP